MVTNDDGLDSPGLLALAGAARASGLDVVVAAPVEEASGSSASITATEASAVTAAGGQGSIRVERRTLPGMEVPAFAVYAAPALIVLLAAHRAFSDGPPDLVLSGINRGANVGRAILHSGTVGAALTGGLNGARGLAVSLATDHTDAAAHWSSAAAVTSRVLPALLASSSGTVLNVNVPNTPRADGLTITSAPLAPFGIVHTTMVEAGSNHVHLILADTPEEHEAHTDAALLGAGVATVTSITGIGERGSNLDTVVNPENADAG
ncbi:MULTISPECIES: 5'/3'-nucleotidase SurE [unclassified Dietzia]|uniref:5'/3'-nucleotidase SurE n=1 Tax=unclassified Dietzia TaxID=2617939 RepID=UPI0013182C58|nr:MULTISPECIES: 5'/3'-nucleotidase SurE [unclassified Dietzia]QGW26385.1 stationary phase survival protein SurE [Dietzia sp. DQ12-45-1b]